MKALLLINLNMKALLLINLNKKALLINLNMKALLLINLNRKALLLININQNLNSEIRNLNWGYSLFLKLIITIICYILQTNITYKSPSTKTPFKNVSNI